MSSVAISVRIPETDLVEIDRRARTRGVSRTAFLLEAALAPELERTTNEEHLEQLEERLSRLEAVTFGTNG